MKQFLLKYMKFVIITMLVFVIGIIYTLMGITNKDIIAPSFIFSSNAPYDDTMPAEAWKNEDYWEWHTRTTTDDGAYNGRHIVMNNDVITFYGYGVVSYKDFLYKNYERSGRKIFTFTIDESEANYHTLDGAGFIFDANIAENKLSGYILLFKKDKVCLYRLDEVDIDEFETTPGATLDTYGELIESVDKLESNIHELTVEATPVNIKVTDGGEEILNVNLDGSLHVGESFGLISSYAQHSCSQLSKIEFSNLGILVQDYEIYMINVDQNNKPISGGYFKVYNTNGNVVREGYVDGNGKFNMDGLNRGKYTVSQTLTPEGYETNANPIEFYVTLDGRLVDNDGNEMNLVFQNNLKTFNTCLVNTDKAGNPIGGGYFKLQDAEGNVIKEGYADENGRFNMNRLVQGNYTISQANAPNGYVPNNTSITFIVTADGEIVNGEGEAITLVVENEQSDGGDLGEGSDPSDGGNPGEGGNPSDGGDSGEGSNPSDGGNSEEGGNPSDGGDSGEGNTPSDEDNPEEGNNPSDGGDSGEGNTPSDEDNPEEGNNPSDGGDSGEGNTPSDEDNPEEGNNPSDGGDSGEGNTPSDEDNPEEGNDPSDGGDSGEGNTPSDEDDPEEGNTPSDEDTPGEDNTPSDGDNPSGKPNRTISKDNTIVEKTIPHTGMSIVTIRIMIAIVSIGGICLLIKLRKCK